MYLLQMQFFSILMHISVIQFRYLYRDNCILNTDTIVSIFKQELTFNSLGKSYLSFSRGEDFLEIKHSETRIACGGHVCYPIGAK